MLPSTLSIPGVKFTQLPMSMKPGIMSEIGNARGHIYFGRIYGEANRF